MPPENIMTPSRVLPEDFDGTFPFTNYDEEEFIGVWAKKQYHFPPLTTSKMNGAMFPENSPLEIQQIRKKFAKDLAEKVFYRSDQYSSLHRQERNTDGSPRLNSIHQAGTYGVDQLTPLIQRALEPLPAGQATITKVESVPLEENLTRNDEGELNTVAIDRRTSLRKKALEA